MLWVFNDVQFTRPRSLLDQPLPSNWLTGLFFFHAQVLLLLWLPMCCVYLDFLSFTLSCYSSSTSVLKDIFLFLYPLLLVDTPVHTFCFGQFATPSRFKLLRFLSVMTMVAWIMIRAVRHATLCRRFCQVTALMWHGEFSLAVSGGRLLIILRTIKTLESLYRI